jgi:hypothetical protein
VIGRILHRTRLAFFYGLSGLLTMLLTAEFFAHLLLPTPVVTQWAAPHHIHSLAHAVLTAILIPLVGAGLVPRFRSVAALRGLLLVVVIGLAISLIAWGGFHDLAFPVFNFTVYGVFAVLILLLHPDRPRLFSPGPTDRWLAGMAVLGSIPLIAYAIVETKKQLTGVQPEHFGHFALMAALAVILVALAAMGSVRMDGSRLLVWAAGLGAAVLGIGSLAFPLEASSFALPGALAAIGWGVLIIWLDSRQRAAVTTAQRVAARQESRADSA